MTIEKKLDWLSNARDEDLLRQLISLSATDRYGCNAEDIELTRNEILRRMGSKNNG